MGGQPSFTQNPPVSSMPPDGSHREHLRELCAGLAHTSGIIKRGSAALLDSTKLLNRLNGAGDGAAAAGYFSHGNSEPSG